MLFGAVARDGKDMLSYFIDTGLKINMEEYLKVLEEVLSRQIKKNYDSIEVMFIK